MISLTKTNPINSGFIPCLVLFFLFSSCDKNDAPADDADSTSACKTRPGRITFGRDVSEIKYNARDQPIAVTITTYNPAAPSQPPLITVYAISYVTNGKTDRITKSVNNQAEQSYQAEYNTEGLLTKLTRFNVQGVLIATTQAEYDNSNLIVSIITEAVGSSSNVTSYYYYTNGNLVTKSIQQLYDSTSQEMYDAYFTYTYFPDQENKVRSYFEGPLGLILISDLANQSSLQYLPGTAPYQLFFARETAAENRLLKNIEIIAHRYGASDTTDIDYSYDYAADGFPTGQKGKYTNVTRRFVPTPFGGLVLLVTPRIDSFKRTMNFFCK